MGEMDIEKMKRLLQWVRELTARAWRNLKNSRFFLAIICLIIGSTYTYVYMELKPTYLQIREGYDTATTFMQIRTGKDGLVSQDTVPNQVNEPTEVKNSMESLETDSPAVLSIVDKVYQLESSGGLNDQKCERLGRHNGYGFGQWEGHNTCFSSDDEARDQVIKWFESKLKVMTLEEALKIYSGNSLSYVANFNSLT